jgi:hypothetical protein
MTDLDPNYSQQMHRGSVSSLSLPISPNTDPRASQFFQSPSGNPAPQPSASNLFQTAAENLRTNGAWNSQEEQRRWSERPGMGAGIAFQRPMSSFGLPPTQPLRNSISTYDVGSNPRPRSASFQRPTMNDGRNMGSNFTGSSSSTAGLRSTNSGGALSPGIPQPKQMSLAERIQSDMRAKQAEEQLKRLQMDEEQRVAQARELDPITEGEVSRMNSTGHHPISRTASNVSHTSHTTPSRVSSTRSTASTSSHHVPSRGSSTASHRSRTSSQTPVSPRPVPSQTSSPKKFPADDQIPESEEQALPPPLSPQVNLSPPAEENPEDGDLIKFSETGEPMSKPRHHSYMSDLNGIRPPIPEEERPVSPEGERDEDDKTPENKPYQDPHADNVELPNQWNEPVELQHIERARTPSHPSAVELHNQWSDPVELHHSEPTRKAPPRPTHPTAVELPNQWNEPVELQHTNSTRNSHPQVAELYNQWSEPLELPLTEPKPKHKRAPPPPRPPKHAVAELAHSKTTHNSHRPAVAELPTSPPAPVSNALNSTNIAELPGSVFDDVDALLGLGPVKSAPATLPSTSRPSHSPSISVSSHTETRENYLNNVPPREVIDPHSLYAELPPNSPAPPPYTLTADTSATFNPTREIPEPAPFTFELSTSPSVRYTPKTRPTPQQRETRMQSDPNIYNTLPGEGFPIKKDEPERRATTQYPVTHDGRGQMNTYEVAPPRRQRAPPPPLPYPNSPAVRPVQLPYPIEPEIDPRTGRRYGS